MALAPNLAALVAALALFGAANGIMDVAMNAHGVAVETRLQQPIMSSLHGMFSLGGLLGAGAGARAAGLAAAGGACPDRRDGARWRTAFLVMRHLLPGRVDVGDAGPHFVLPTRAALGFGALAFLVLMTEGAVLDWSAAWLRGDLGASPSMAATAFAAFSATMAAGRFGGDRLRRRFGRRFWSAAARASAAAGLALALLLATPRCGAVVGFAWPGSASPTPCRCCSAPPAGCRASSPVPRSPPRPASAIWASWSGRR